ncbi:hypothetical protein DSM106972_036650 [Dulcicalothrix desertica PCC 7102]|uniref:Photosystem reaction center subunit H n=1 Tax=Dulcicalothrix desertica PCC 7102 TaxID=232991 RepID=A0A3S1CP11_9CYAN|nr:DUF2382 domain-containing protein [Dulcicalothrix desertica]RUT05658.1 hypothetical protein DSM106972_036650 [Dulcicalothrix desertica PCC 7102]TWH39675.1 uncharacterized protein (TIGR02271 family) [Dulcicalothrix desertica PCC 7102]
MALVKITDYYVDSIDSRSDVDDIDNFDVYTLRHEKVGTVHNILVDETSGCFRYIVVDTGFWIFGKKVLLPVGRADIHYTDKIVYAKGLTKEQVEELPNYDELEEIGYDYEEQVRGVYRGSVASSGLTQPADADRGTYNYEQDSSLYDISETNSQTDGQSLKLYEERLIANKQRQKAGEVSIGKHVETETARVAVPVEKERVVIERTSPTSTKPASAPTNAFRSGEVARMDIYEEKADIHKEAIVKEEIRVKKVVDTETVEAQEKIRREELDIDTQGRPIVNK